MEVQGLGNVVQFYSLRQTWAGFGPLKSQCVDQGFRPGQYFLWFSHCPSCPPPQICSSVAMCSPPIPAPKIRLLYSESQEAVEEREIIHTAIQKLRLKEEKTPPNGNFRKAMFRRRSNFQEKM